MDNVLMVIIITIAIATVLNVFLKKYDIPTVIGYIISGFAISTLFHFSSDSREMLSHIAEFGIVFLMFTIGLEFSIHHLKSMKKEVFLYGGLEVVLSGLLFTGIAHGLLGIGMKSAIIIGFALSLSSTAIVLKILNEKNLIHSGYGKVSLGILLFQDLAVIPILLMISIFTSETDSISTLLWQTLTGAVIVFLTIFIVGKYFIERFFDWITASDSEEIFLISVLFSVVSASYLAERFGFSYSLGAFLIGMTIAETKYRYRIEADLVPFRDILLGVFFVTIGMQIDWHSFVSHGGTILLLLLGILLLKGMVIFAALQFFVQKRSALKTALALFQVGEFALAIFALAVSHGLISGAQNQILIITVVASMILTPFVLNHLTWITDRIIKEPETLRERALTGGGSHQHHIVICGYGAIGEKLAAQFREKNLPYVILDHDVKTVDTAIAQGESDIYLANAAQKMVLEHFNVNESCAIIVTMENEIQRELICENIASFDNKINSIVKVNNRAEAEVISGLGIKHVINGRHIIADLLAKEALSCASSVVTET